MSPENIMLQANSAIQNVCRLYGQNADDPEFSMILCVKGTETNKLIIHGASTESIISCMASIIDEYLRYCSDNDDIENTLNEFFARTQYLFSLKEELYEPCEKAESLDEYFTGEKNYAFSSCFVNRYSTKYKSCMQKKFDEAMYKTLAESIKKQVVLSLNKLSKLGYDYSLSYYYAGLGITAIHINAGNNNLTPDIITKPLRCIYKSALGNDNKPLKYDVFAGYLHKMIKNLESE